MSLLTDVIYQRLINVVRKFAILDKKGLAFYNFCMVIIGRVTVVRTYVVVVNMRG